MGLKEDLEYNRRELSRSGFTKSADSGQPEFYQYQWELSDRDPNNEPIFNLKSQNTDGTDSIIQDVIDKTGKKVGAYNTQTGFRYGLTRSDYKPTQEGESITDQVLKNQQLNVDSDSPDPKVNNTVNSVMGNSLLTSPLSTVNNQGGTPLRLEQQSDPKKGYYISRATQNALDEINPDAPDLSYGEQVVDSIKNIKNALQGKGYRPDPYVVPKPVYITQEDTKTMNQQQSEAYPSWITSNNPLNFNK
jgi:hypothetical protein